MMKEVIYMDKETGEITLNHREAVGWFSSGKSIGCMVEDECSSVSDRCQNKEVLSWVH